MPGARVSSSNEPGAWRIQWRQVWILYGREFRSALRDRSVLVNSILIPLLLYPFLLWAGLSMLMIIRGQSEGGVARVVCEKWPEEHLRLRKTLEQKEKFKITELGAGAGITNAVAKFKLQTNREHDIFVQFRDKPGPLPGMFEVHVQYDSSRGSSAAAQEEFTAAVESYREKWIEREARKRGIDPAEWQVFSLSINDVSSNRQRGAFLLGMLLPVIFAVMVATGCFYPAVDTLAGERERGTWETLMSTAAQRSAILIAKYLHVVSFGGLAGILNMMAVMVTIQPIFRTLTKASGRVFEVYVPWQALPLLVLIAVLLAGFIAAGMMVFAAFARTFKEGQSMITPFYLVVMVPIVFLQVPGLKLTLGTACIPVVNLILMLRTALGGKFEWSAMILTIASSLLFIALALAAAAWILHFEEVVTGSYKGNLAKFIRARWMRPTRPEEITR